MALFTENYQEEMMHILKDMAHVRISGTKEEADCAIYLQECCKKMGFETRLEAFQVEMCDIHEAVLTVDGKEIPCKGYRCAGSGTVEAPFYYMPNTDACSLAQCKGKIVMLDGGVGYWGYRDLIENGAVGIITYDGNANYADEDIDLRELRSFVREGSDNKKIPCVNINAKSAIKLVNQNAANAKIVLNQDEWIGDSHNVILDLPGETDEMIVLSAHYDSTPRHRVYTTICPEVLAFLVLQIISDSIHITIAFASYGAAVRKEVFLALRHMLQLMKRT